MIDRKREREERMKERKKESRTESVRRSDTFNTDILL